MKKTIFLLTFLFSVMSLSAQYTPFIPPSYQTFTKNIDGYIVGKRGNDIVLTPIVLKVRFEKADNSKHIRDVSVIAVSQNGIDYTYSNIPRFCAISDDWSYYMKKRNREMMTRDYYKSSSWTSPNNSSIENFYLFELGLIF